MTRNVESHGIDFMGNIKVSKEESDKIFLTVELVVSSFKQVLGNIITSVIVSVGILRMFSGTFGQTPIISVTTPISIEIQLFLGTIPMHCEDIARIIVARTKNSLKATNIYRFIYFQVNSGIPCYNCYIMRCLKASQTFKEVITLFLAIIH